MSLLPPFGDIYNFNVGDYVVIDFDPTWEWFRPWQYRDGGGKLTGCGSITGNGRQVPPENRNRYTTTWDSYGRLFTYSQYPRRGAQIISRGREPGMCHIRMVPLPDDVFTVGAYGPNYRETSIHQKWLRPLSVPPGKVFDDIQENFWFNVIVNHLGTITLDKAVLLVNQYRKLHNPNNDPNNPIYNFNPTDLKV